MKGEYRGHSVKHFMAGGQRQDSLYSQMVSVQGKAVEMGCYDACDWITRNFFAKIEAKEKQQPLINP